MRTAKSGQGDGLICFNLQVTVTERDFWRSSCLETTDFMFEHFRILRGKFKHGVYHPSLLPHHRTCGFPPPAVEPGGLIAREFPWQSKTITDYCLRLEFLIDYNVSGHIGQAPRRPPATPEARPCTLSRTNTLRRPGQLRQCSHLRANSMRNSRRLP